ncbi:F0F1 ATP synthase subunit delta [Synechococcus sp. RSCCF101]|uniref:ATP synthase F1 subunit delta n=1 Tax=Synechococcus sp. RSCCF101 TaxID=2511069 RepID=UPI0012446F3E|nr:ATP synthase F1 subunit delta [Synechococcus sp. RSCCF101]QEY33126.1 F0F1 ATP synthase subunit delta [Synechococcus sp. RSCCF101]
MPLLNAIATPYAEAFLQVCEARDESDLAFQQIKDILAVWESSDELRQAMTSPVLEPAAKKAALELLFAEQVTPALLNLLRLLADRNRTAVLDSVLNRYLELYREMKRIALATVRSATALSDDQQAALRRRILQVAGTESVDMDLTVDPSLIGGFVVSLGSQVIDASLSGQVRRLGLALARTA